MTLKDVLQRLERIIEAPRDWANCPECREEILVDSTPTRDAVSALALDIERDLLDKGEL